MHSSKTSAVDEKFAQMALKKIKICNTFYSHLLPLKTLGTLSCVCKVNIMTKKYTEVYSIHRYALMASNSKDHSAI